MQAGRLNTRFTLQTPATGQDAVGQPVATWSDVGLVWGNVKMASGAETIKSGADASVVKASVRVRAGIPYNAGHRLVSYVGTVFNITAVLPDLAGRQHVDLVCEVVS